MRDQKPTLLLCGQTYCLAVNREKAKALAKHYEVTVATLTLDHLSALGRPLSAFEEEEEKRNYELIRFRALPRWGGVYRSLWFGFGAWMRDRRFDVVLVEAEAWAVFLWQIWWNTDRAGRCGSFAEFSWENLERPGVKGWILDKVYRLGVRKGGRVIAGNRTAGTIWRRRGLPEERLLVAPQLGVDDHFDPVDGEEKCELRQRFGLPEEGFVVGFIGRMVPEKGIGDLVEAVEKARAELSENIQLALLGNGPERQRLEEHPGDWIRFLEPCRHREVAERIQAMDVLVLPSRSKHHGKVWEEQFGHVLIEAMACGVPVIGSGSGAIPEVIGDPELIFESGDPAALLRVLRRMVSHRSWREEKTARLLERVSEHFTHEAIAETYRRFLAIS